MIIKFFRKPVLSPAAERGLIERFNSELGRERIGSVPSEWCLYIMTSEGLSEKDARKLEWILSETFEPGNFGKREFLGAGVLEVGPRLNFATSWFTNARQVFEQCGITYIERIERSRRYLPVTTDNTLLTSEERQLFLGIVHDRMTEQPYPEPLSSFKTGIVPQPVRDIPILERGIGALDEAAKELGLAFDDFDKKHIYNHFTGIGRNPTGVEIFQYGQANSEHSRHGFFKARIIIDSREMGMSLMEMVRRPFEVNPGNSLVAFMDNASVTRGFPVTLLSQTYPDGPSLIHLWIGCNVHILFDAETHNFPCAIAAFPGAETGVGGRLRDDMGVGRGGYIVANTAGYAVGSLFIEGLELPWEDVIGQHPSNIMKPIDILVQASNGASDYGNKFGDPIINGFVRSFDMRIPGGERRAWIKPIMFTGGVGYIREEHIRKEEPLAGMHIVILGGPNYRIGMGGGSASSMGLGDNVEETDQNAVQRADAEKERKVYNSIKACLDMGDKNPIRSIHDMGAGGNCNALPEICMPAGGRIFINRLPLGDDTLSKLEIWGNESQERMVILVDDDGLETVMSICEREKCSMTVAGVITGDGKIVVEDETDGSVCVDMDMGFVLGDIPQKTFEDESIPMAKARLSVPDSLGFRDALSMVLKHPDVASKQYLTVKVDRSVGGKIVVQQCCGPFHLPVADYGLVALGHFDTVGAAISIGQMPVTGLLDYAAMARMSVGEAITNLMFAGGRNFYDIFLCVNAMWAAKKPGETANIYAAYRALTDVQIDLGIGTDGGKDSLTMLALCKGLDGNDEDVKAPGTLVISARVPCPDITKHVTPDIREPGKSLLMHLDFSWGKRRLGGSVFARTLSQLGRSYPDLENPDILRRGYDAVQELLNEGLILAGHDISDGGIAATLCEMAISGGCGIEASLSRKRGLFHTFFSEELGAVFEYLPEKESEVREVLKRHGLSGFFRRIGRTTKDSRVRFYYGKRKREMVLDERLTTIRRMWEITSFMIDRLQSNPETVEEEMRSVERQSEPQYDISFYESLNSPVILKAKKPLVAVIREEGTNADDEMRSALYLAGFDVLDLTMTDIIRGSILDKCQMVVFPGGFSYADVLDAGKGWAATIVLNERVREQFDRFYERCDTLSFGVCNGCQMMALIGWVPWKGIPTEKQPRFIRNTSERFECRFPSVRILKSPAVMLRRMEGSLLGVWTRHGEGRFFCKEQSVLDEILAKGLAPIRFVGPDGNETIEYPFNPNGSVHGITAVTSPDGRHLAMMPHPEALFKIWQWPWIPRKWKSLEHSPWFQMFMNAREFFE